MSKEDAGKLRPDVLWTATLSSVAVLLLTALRWTLVDLIGLYPLLLLQALVGLVFLSAMVWSILYVVFRRNAKWRDVIPLLICVTAIVAVTTLPFTSLWLMYNFSSHRTVREQIVQDILTGTLQPDKSSSHSLVKLGLDTPAVSMGGNEVIVEKHEGDTYILFFTFRGILDNYAGFLYVPENGDPKLFYDLNESDSTELVKYDTNWYYVSHW